ncbi:MAG: hypothetical protein J6J54_01755 [Bacteroidales bacterium]|nr:hypothetical protein [Bacteroidales bacterium]
MKTILRFAALCILFCAVDCVENDFYYMPFKETEYGADKVSFYMDGTPYRSVEQLSLTSGADSLNNWFYLKAQCVSETHTGTRIDLRISVRVEDGSVLTHTQVHEVQPYFTMTPETEDALYWSEPHARAAVGTIYADEGWIQFRRADGKIYAGNFEFTFSDDKGERHTIRYGNFDTYCR